MTSNSSSVSSGLTMLTTGVSQYLHPDYLQPLPITLDAKKSPLALLAQTCSAIGKDSSPSKPIIPPLEKGSKDGDKSSSDRSGHSDSPSSGSKRPNSRGHKESSGRDSSNNNNKPGFRTFPPTDIPALVPIPANGDNNNNNGSSKSSRMPGEPKPSTSPLTNGGATSLTVPTSSLPRPGSATGAPRTSSRGSSNGKSEPADHHHHHNHHNGSHHHQHSSSSSHNHHHHHHSSPSSSHHRHRDSPASSSSSSSSSYQARSSSSPTYSKPASGSHLTSVMQSPSSTSTISSSSAIKPHAPPLASHPAMLGALPPHLAGYANPLALMGHGLDASSYHSAALAAHSSLSSYSAAAAAAAAQSSAALKAAAAGGAAGLSPFVTYARVRTPSGATTLVPVCRDPYCSTCQLTVQTSHLAATCNAPPGCAQCAHEKSLTSLSALGAGLPGAAAASSMLGLPHLPPSSSAQSMSALSSLHSLYPHSALAAAAAAAHQGLPYVCNWVAGSDYCGKRFNSSEELLQHLRTHTSSLDMGSLAASYAGLGGFPSASALGAYHHHLSVPPLSPNSLRRAYPTSLSPVSSLLSASRYHPYKSPLSGVAAPPPQSLPPVGPYYAPYTLYGQRIGAAVVP